MAKINKNRKKTFRDRLPVASSESLSGILGLVSWNVSAAVIDTWDQDTRDLVQEWAAREHFAASDNPVRRRPLPAILKFDARVQVIGL